MWHLKKYVKVTGIPLFLKYVDLPLLKHSQGFPGCMIQRLPQRLHHLYGLWRGIYERVHNGKFFIVSDIKFKKSVCRFFSTTYFYRYLKRRYTEKLSIHIISREKVQLYYFHFVNNSCTLLSLSTSDSAAYS